MRTAASKYRQLFVKLDFHTYVQVEGLSTYGAEICMEFRTILQGGKKLKTSKYKDYPISHFNIAFTKKKKFELNRLNFENHTLFLEPQTLFIRISIDIFFHLP